MEENNKDPFIGSFVRRLQERFGKTVFIVDKLGANYACLKSEGDSEVSFSVIGQDNGLYSIQIEASKPELANRIIPFDISLARDDVTLEELLDIFDKYRKK